MAVSGQDTLLVFDFFRHPHAAVALSAHAPCCRETDDVEEINNDSVIYVTSNYPIFVNEYFNTKGYTSSVEIFDISSDDEYIIWNSKKHTRSLNLMQNQKYNEYHMFFIIDDNNSVRVWDSGRVNCFAYHDINKTLYTSYGSSLHFWDISTGNAIDYINEVGNKIFSGSRD